MPSIVIPAHNEAGVIRRLLEQLRLLPQGYQVVVVCNGCTDDTAEIARRALPDADVVEIAVGSKPLALNTGDRVATSFPRVYLDSDVTTTAASIVRLVDAVSTTSLVAAAMTPTYDLSTSSWLVRSHWRLWTAMATNATALSGTNAMAVTEEGRRRFSEWPDLIGDDYFFDGLFSDGEKARVVDAIVIRTAPRGFADCVSRKARINQGNRDVLAAGLRSRHGGGGSSSVVRAVAARPSLLVDLPAHVAVTLTARALGAWRLARGTHRTFYRDRSRGA